jgi:hypothetical protein
MSASCTLCAVLNGEIDANDVPLEFLHASSARMVTHFVSHPSLELANSIARLFTLIGTHIGLEDALEGARHYAELADKWRELIAVARQRGHARDTPPRQFH